MRYTPEAFVLLLATPHKCRLNNEVTLVVQMFENSRDVPKQGIEGFWSHKSYKHLAYSCKTIARLSHVSHTNVCMTRKTVRFYRECVQVTHAGNAKVTFTQEMFLSKSGGAFKSNN